MPGQLCDTDVNLLEDWKWDPNITARYGDFLTVQGWNDLKILALDYQKRFPALLEFIYTPNKFQVNFKKLIKKFKTKYNINFLVCIHGLSTDGSQF